MCLCTLQGVHLSRLSHSGFKIRPIEVAVTADQQASFVSFSSAFKTYISMTAWGATCIVVQGISVYNLNIFLIVCWIKALQYSWSPTGLS